MIPNGLKKGDLIGVVAPSSPVLKEKFEELKLSASLMESFGFKILFSKNILANDLGYSASVEKKVDDIHDMFKNRDVKAIFCATGGANSNSLFDFLDYELIKANPKIFCGFSDSTSLLNVINLKTGLVTFHGPTFKSLTSWETDYGFKEVIKRFVDLNLELGMPDDEYTVIKYGKYGKNEEYGKSDKNKKSEYSDINENSIVQGELIGGNLSLVRELVTGKYCLDFTDKILFIEELGFESDPEMVSNYIYFMLQNGVFDKIKGLWIGNYEHESGISLEKIVTDVIGDIYNFPIIKSNNFGHTDGKTVIPIGIKACIDTNSDTKIRLVEKCVKNV